MKLDTVIALLEAADLSHSEQEDAIRAALKAAHPEASWVNLYSGGVWDDHVIYRLEVRDAAGGELDAPRDPDLLYQRDYTIDDAGVVTLADPIQVEKVVTFVPVAAPATESRERLHGDVIRLLEAKGQKRKIKLIDPGWGSSGYYSKEMLKRDAPATFPAKTHMYIDHSVDGRSVKELAAVLDTGAKFDEHGGDGPGVYATATIAAPWVDTIDALAEDIGVSINASGTSSFGEAEGRQGVIVETLFSREEDPFTSVDFVPLAGRGGKVLELVESLRAKSASPAAPDAHEDDQNTQATEALTSPKEGAAMDETEAKQLQESNAQLTTENAQLRERVALSEARTIVDAKLAESELPEITKQRLAESLVRGATLGEDGKLAASFGESVGKAIADEVDYVAKLTESGRVRDQGGDEPAGTELKERAESAYARITGSADKGKRAAAGLN